MHAHFLNLALLNLVRSFNKTSGILNYCVGVGVSMVWFWISGVLVMALSSIDWFLGLRGGSNSDNGGNGTTISRVWLSMGELLVPPELLRFLWFPGSLSVKFGVMPVEIIGCGMVCDGGVGNGLMYFQFLRIFC